MAEDKNLKKNFDNVINSIQHSGREILNSSEVNNTDISSISTALSGTTTSTGLSESDATHFRLRDGATEDFEYLTCLSCGETFKSTSIIEVYDHYRERPHLKHYGNCIYCQGKVYQYYQNRQQQVKYYHNCLRSKRGEDN